MLSKYQFGQLDEVCINELGKKLVWDTKGPMQSAVEYNRYVVNSMMFSHFWKKIKEIEFKTMATVDGPTNYRKLLHIIEVRYYDDTRYVLFKCD